MIRYAAEIILLTVVLGRISYTAAITPSRYSSVEEAAVGRSVWALCCGNQHFSPYAEGGGCNHSTSRWGLVSHRV